jgi:hypothetical protein
VSRVLILSGELHGVAHSEGSIEDVVRLYAGEIEIDTALSRQRMSHDRMRKGFSFMSRRNSHKIQ